MISQLRTGSLGVASRRGRKLDNRYTETRRLGGDAQQTRLQFEAFTGIQTAYVGVKRSIQTQGKPKEQR